MCTIYGNLHLADTKVNVETTVFDSTVLMVNRDIETPYTIKLLSKLITVNFEDGDTAVNWMAVLDKEKITFGILKSKDGKVKAFAVIKEGYTFLYNIVEDKEL